MEEERYKAALERAKSAIKECGDNVGRIKMIESIFPELGESGEEKIRKAIIAHMNLVKSVNGIDVSDILAYLEKVKDFDKQLEEAYKNSDEVQYKRGYDKGYMDGYWYWGGAIEELEKQAAIKDGNSIDPHFGKHIITDCGAKEKIQEKIIELSHKEVTKKSEQDSKWSEDDEEMLNCIIDDFGAGRTYSMLQKSWLKSIKDRIQPKPKQEWSEEDKEMKDLIDEISCQNDDVDYETHVRIMRWLNELKQRLS